MKQLSRLFRPDLTAIVLALLFAARAQAETPREELVHAYILMNRANADYHGHRVNAMAEIEAAGGDLGLRLEGKDLGVELQLKSDEQLAAAKRLLIHARDQLEERDRLRVAVHVEKAIKELDAALASVAVPVHIETPREELVHAYILMNRANANYHGHRVNAMAEIEAAGKDLGLHLEGRDLGEEFQLKSDEQLMAAKRLLVHAREKLEERDRLRVAIHVEKAIKELDAALASVAVPVHIETAREELIHAYILMNRANANYHGHRVNAMAEIEAAGKDLGLRLEGKDLGEELQFKSDEQLAAARKLLVHALEKLENRDRLRVAIHVEKAVKELDAALASVAVPIHVETPREELVHAYVLMNRANADYHGHRVNAMAELEAAGRDLGLRLEGKDLGEELQLKSDEQLAAARKLLVHALGQLEERDRLRTAAHLANAIREIGAALKVN